MNRLVFGTPGIPLSARGLGTGEGIKQVKNLGLGAMELEFVRQVNISAEKAPGIKKIAMDEGIVLTAHAPYYINLNSQEPEKKKASIERLVNSARALSACGGWSVCFHAGYYMEMPHKIVFENVKEGIEAVLESLKTEGIKIWIRPEIGGKTTSWGSLEEILEMSRQLGIQPCIDWAHLHARSLGKNNSYQEFSRTLEKIESVLGREALDNMHCHVEGIQIGKTGENRHTNLEETDFDYQALCQAFRGFSLKGVIISESPNVEKDAILLQKTYRSL